MHGSDDSEGLLTGINVTPLVDVTLVLLIIFMVTARIIAQAAVPMDLPRAATGEQVQTVFSVELMADGRTLVDSKPVQGEARVRSLARSAVAKNQGLRAVIRADRQVQHGRVIEILDLLKREKVQRIAFAVSPTTDAKDLDVQ